LKKGYCPECGRPTTFWTKLKIAISDFLISAGLMLIIVILGAYIMMVNYPKDFMNFGSMMASVTINNIAGYKYDEKLKIVSNNIVDPKQSDVDNMLLLRDWVHDNINYSFDASLETWQSPHETIERGFGDCDDMSVLFCGLARQQGMICRITCDGFHCWCVVKFPHDGRVWKVDPTLKSYELVIGG